MRWVRRHSKTALAVLLVGFVILHGQSTPPRQPYTTWRDYGGGEDSMQYSALKQINKSNVSKLELAWSYTVPDHRGNFGFNPVIVDNVMYVLGRENAFVALDAATGKRIWSRTVDGNPGKRGINYWESNDRKDRRLILERFRS